MNNLTQEDLYLIQQGIDPFSDGARNPNEVLEAEDALFKALAAKEKFRKQQIPVGTDLYYELNDPTLNQDNNDALLMEMLDDRY